MRLLLDLLSKITLLTFFVVLAGCGGGQTDESSPTSLAITSSKIEKIDQSSVYVDFKLNQHAQALVEYGPTTQYGQFTTKETSFNYASHRQRIFNLNANTLYHYRVHAFDEAGNEVISDDATFRIKGLSKKHLIFLDGYLGWHYTLPNYVAQNHEKLESLPFSGFTIVGNVFTSYAMSSNPNNNNVTYERVWDEVKSLKGVFQTKKDNFLRINLDFPGDFWDDAVWEKTAQNFAAVAKAAKDIGFKGILFDDEVYATKPQHEYAYYMSNFRFPKKADVQANPGNYAQWEIDESKSNRGDWMDYSCYIGGVKEVDSNKCSYRNPDYTFKEHMAKVASRFKAIMQAMEAEYPEITVLVLHGPSTAHSKTNTVGHYIKPSTLYESEEYKGAMFLGFKQGLKGAAELHDMGEFYAYSTDEHFENAYQWRKFDIATAQYNQDIDDNYRWVIPVGDRATWSDDVGIGFMVSDYDRPHNARGDYDTSNLCKPEDVETRFKHAFNHSDNYVLFYSDSSLSSCENDIRWMDVATPVKANWLDMVQRVYDRIQ